MLIQAIENRTDKESDLVKTAMKDCYNIAIPSIERHDGYAFSSRVDVDWREFIESFVAHDKKDDTPITGKLLIEGGNSGILNGVSCSNFTVRIDFRIYPDGRILLRGNRKYAEKNHRKLGDPEFPMMDFPEKEVHTP